MPPENKHGTTFEPRMREIERLHAECYGRNTLSWEHQEKRNAKIDAELVRLWESMSKKFGDLSRKITALEVKVATYAGIASMIGAAAAKYLLP